MMEFDGIKKKDVEKRQSLQGEIKSYKLSDEELAKVREETGWNRDEFNKEIYIQRRQEGKTDRQIMKEYNLYPKKLTNLKHEWGLIGVKQEEFLAKQKQAELEVEEKEIANKDAEQEVKELLLRIKKLEEYEVQSAERICNLETDNASLVEELEHYKSTLAKERDEASSEYERLLKKNSELAEIVKDLKEEIEILEGGIEERDGENDELNYSLEKQAHKLNQLTKAYDDLVQEKNLLRSQLGQLNSESCQYCKKIKKDNGGLWADKNKLIVQIAELEEEIEWLKNELTTADEFMKYKRLWESTAFALKEMIDVELFGGDEDARD